eukprot:m51a1_g14603 hypothetical protein (254) ;mRNA; r:1192401-1193445
MLARTYPRKKGAAALYHLCLMGLALSRLLWFAAREPGGSAGVLTALNHVGFCCFLMGFSLIILFWFQLAHLTQAAPVLTRVRRVEQFLEHVNNGDRWLGPIKCTIILVNVFFLGLRKQDDPLYCATTDLLIGATALISMVVLVIATLLCYMQRNAWWRESAQGRETRKIAVSAAVFCLCCVLRIAVFCHIPAIMQREELYYVLGYWFPEFVSSLIQVFIIQTSGDQYLADCKIVEELFREAAVNDPLVSRHTV